MAPGARTNEKLSAYGLVLITGGSSGIGKALIERILNVESGPRICNLSRSKPDIFFNDQKLTHLECDLSQPTARKAALLQVEKLIETLPKDKPILLINNAGFGLYEAVDSKPTQEHLELIEVNISALVELSLALLPHTKARGGGIMNIASTSAFQATPYLATYGASKTFVLNWTLALNEELRDFPAHAIAVCPGPTASNFHQRAGFPKGGVPRGLSHSAAAVAEAALNALAKGKRSVTIGFANKLAACFSSCLPRTWSAWLAGRVIRSFRNPNID